jgi:hypothetical protein
MLSFQQVVERLRNLAYRLGAGADTARAEIAVIDVSDILIPDPPKRKARASASKASGVKRGNDATS